jgi:hypothetical protein
MNGNSQLRNREHVMPFKSVGDDFIEKIFNAEDRVAKATANYRRGGSLDTLNKAQADLANSQYRWREWRSGLVPDDR